MNSKAVTVKVAVLDDYPNLAMRMADWSALKDRATITVFNDHIAGTDSVVERLHPFDVVNIMRERTPLSREIIARLPNLKLTKGMVGEAELALMKPTSRLINTSRGPVVNDEALIKVLQARKIAGAALDVFDVEPLPADHPYRSLDNVLGAPHIAYGTEGLYRTFYQDTVDNISAWLDEQ